MPANRQSTGRKVPKTAFKPGQSGNPNGRPKQTPEQKDALEQIRSLAPEAVMRLRELISKPDTKGETVIRAIEIVLERTYGKAAAKIAVTSGSLEALNAAFEAMKADDEA